MIGCQDTDPNIPTTPLDPKTHLDTALPTTGTQHQDASEPSTEDEIDTEPMPLPDLLMCQ